MNTNNQNEKEWVILDEAEKCSIYSKRQIQKLAEKGNQRIRTKKTEDGKHVLYNKIDILQYAASHPRDTILNTVWDEIERIEGEVFYPLYGYDCKYFTTNKNRIINCSNGQVLTPQLQKDIKGKLTGYKQVVLMKNGKKKCESLHRLIGLTQCPNAFGYDIFHHIKISFPSNDSASNLLPVANREVHAELHKLIDEGKTKEYNNLVKLMKKENRQNLYKIQHPDYEPDDKFIYYMYLTSDGYKAYRNNQDIPNDSIKMESAECKEVTNN